MLFRSKDLRNATSEAYHKAKADGSNPELVKAVEKLLGNPTEQPKETIPNVETKKADIPLGKVGNTEYEVKSDGVYYKDKKLDNPENKTHRQLIEADIERRRKENPSVERGVLINFDSGKTKEQLIDIVSIFPILSLFSIKTYSINTYSF